MYDASERKKKISRVTENMVEDKSIELDPKTVKI